MALRIVMPATMMPDTEKTGRLSLLTISSASRAMSILYSCLAFILACQVSAYFTAGKGTNGPARLRSLCCGYPGDQYARDRGGHCDPTENREKRRFSLFPVSVSRGSAGPQPLERRIYAFESSSVSACFFCLMPYGDRRGPDRGDGLHPGDAAKGAVSPSA